MIFIFLALAGSARAAEEEKKSIFGRALDQAVYPLRELLAPYQSLETIVVTPSRSQEADIDVSKNISVIDSEEIEEMHPRYVPDLLESESGIVVRDFLGNGKTAQVDIRGFGDTSVSNTLVLIDGRRTNQIDISGVDWTQINASSIDTIEVSRGGQSVLYGDNATGGVINIITKSGKGKKPQVSADYRSGSYRYNYGSAAIEGGTDFLDYYGGMSYSYNAGYRTNNHLETSDYYGNVTMKPADSLKIRFEGGYHNDWYGQPGSLRPADIDVVGWRGSVTPNDRAKTEDAYFMASPEARYEFGPSQFLVSCDISVRSRRTSSLLYNTNNTNSEQNTRIKTLGVTPKVELSAEFFNINNKFIMGLDYYGNRYTTTSTHFDSDDFWTTFYMNGWDKMAIKKDTLGLYVTDSIEPLSGLILNGGYRAEWAKYKFNQESMVAGINTRSPFVYGAEAGVVYKYNEKSSVYANYSRSFRFPAVDEWYQTQYQDVFTGTIQGGLNLNLVPQTANNYEIGIKENSSKYVRAKADYFVMDTKHEIYFDPSTYANSVYDRTMRHGLELDLHAYPVNGLDAIFNYTFEKAFYVGGSYAGHDIPMVPRHKFSAGFEYVFMDCVYFRYMANFLDLRRFLNDQQNLAPRMKSYVTHDIKMSYYKYGLEVYGAIYNIFDEKYAALGTSNATGTLQVYYPSPGVNYAVGAKYKF